MAQNRIHLSDSLMAELGHIFNDHTINGETYPEYARIVRSSGSPSISVTYQIIIEPVVAPVVKFDYQIGIGYVFSDDGPYDTGTFGDDHYPLRSASLSVLTAAKSYRAVLAAGDFLVDYFDGRDVVLGKDVTRRNEAIPESEWFKISEIEFSGETGVEKDDTEIYLTTYEFSLIYPYR